MDNVSASQNTVTINPQPQPASPQPAPASPPSKKPWVKSLLLLEVGLFEVLFVLFLLGITFFVLNYFNIVSLSRVFPQLSFLPHKQDIKSIAQPIPAVPFTYDANIASDLIQKYAQQTLLPSYLPISPSPEASSSAFSYIQDKNTFTAPWNIANGKVGTSSAYINAQAILAFTTDTNTAAYFSLHMDSANPPILTFPILDAKKAALLVAQKMFKEDVSNKLWECSGSYIVQCTLHTKNKTQSTQYTMTLRQDSQATQSAVVSVRTCIIPTDSPVKTCPQ